MESVTLVTLFGNITFDATLEVQTKSSVTLPSYPTESGVQINDHRIVMPQECRIKGIVASTPMGFTIDSFISRLSRLTSVRPSTFLEALKELQMTGRPFTIVTRYEVLENMMIRDIEPTNNAEQEDSLTFDVKCQEFITVNKLVEVGQPIVEILNADDPSQSAISANVRTGEVPTTPSTGYFNDAAEKVLNLT